MSGPPQAPGGGGPPSGRPTNFVIFGPKANCTLELCPVEMSVYGYRPSLAANGLFIALFSLAALIHAYLGIRWRSWWFMWCMINGCLGCVAGYAGRIALYYNPWSFPAFMVQIILVGTAPVMMCAAIYVTLAKTVAFLSPAHSRLPPKAYYWIFIPCDLVALALQAVGGALSTTTSGASQTGVNLGLAGLSFQVATMTAFIACFLDYMVRYFSSGEAVAVSGRLKFFLAGLGSATMLILGRSAYRVEELSKGYSGPSIRNEPLYIALEGVIIVIATYLLMIGHPGLVVERGDFRRRRTAVDGDGLGAVARQREKRRTNFHGSHSSNDI